MQTSPQSILEQFHNLRKNPVRVSRHSQFAPCLSPWATDISASTDLPFRDSAYKWDSYVRLISLTIIFSKVIHEIVHVNIPFYGQIIFHSTFYLPIH